MKFHLTLRSGNVTVTKPNQAKQMKLNRYKIKFLDCGEPQEWIVRAPDAEGAELRFWNEIDSEFGGPEGIRILEVTRCK